MSSIFACLLLALTPAFAMETTGQNCGIDAPSHRVIEDDAAWTTLWKELGKPAPAADFKKEFGVAVFAGTRSSGGHKIVIEEPKQEKDSLVVRYSVKKPKGMATMALTTPYAVKTFTRAGRKPIKLEERKP